MLASESLFLILALINGIVLGSLRTIGALLPADSLPYLSLDNSNSNLSLILNSSDVAGWHLPNRLDLGTRNYYMCDVYWKEEQRDYLLLRSENVTVQHRTNESTRILPRDTLNPWVNLTEIYRDALNHHRAEGLPELQIGEVHLPQFPEEGRGPRTLLGCALWKELLLTPLLLLVVVTLALYNTWYFSKEDCLDGQSLVSNSRTPGMTVLSVYILYLHTVSLIFRGVFNFGEPSHFVKLVRGALEGSSGAQYGITYAGEESEIMVEVVLFFGNLEIGSIFFWIVMSLLCLWKF